MPKKQISESKITASHYIVVSMLYDMFNKYKKNQNTQLNLVDKQYFISRCPFEVTSGKSFKNVGSSDSDKSFFTICNRKTSQKFFTLTHDTMNWLDNNPEATFSQFLLSKEDIPKYSKTLDQCWRVYKQKIQEINDAKSNNDSANNLFEIINNNDNSDDSDDYRYHLDTDSSDQDTKSDEEDNQQVATILSSLEDTIKPSFNKPVTDKIELINNDESITNNNESIINNDESITNNDESITNNNESIINNDESIINNDEPIANNNEIINDDGSNTNLGDNLKNQGNINIISVEDYWRNNDIIDLDNFDFDCYITSGKKSTDDSDYSDYSSDDGSDDGYHCDNEQKGNSYDPTLFGTSHSKNNNVPVINNNNSELLNTDFSAEMTESQPNRKRDYMENSMLFGTQSPNKMQKTSEEDTEEKPDNPSSPSVKG